MTDDRQASFAHALVKDGVSCAVLRMDAPSSPAKADEVVVRVAWAGICRTDLYAAEGRLPTKSGRVVLGHEASGVIHAVGPVGPMGPRAAPEDRAALNSPHALKVGDRVTIVPRARCGACESCVRGLGPLDCDAPERLGLDRDGVFAEYVCLPSSSVEIIPATLPLRLAAYVEPVAAALAVLSVGLESSERGLIYGSNRIAELTLRVLRAHGIHNVAIVSERDAANVKPRSVDFAIETTATSTMFSTLLHAVRRRGRILLKSRPFEPVAINVSDAVEKEIALLAVRYAPFAEAIRWLDERKLVVDDLLGEDFTLDRFEDAFRAARKEATKPFFKLSSSSSFSLTD